MSTETTAEVITIKRDGKPPLRFTGTRIADADNRSHQGDRQNRWTVLRLHQTKGGKYVIERTHRTIWEGEANRTAAESMDTAVEVQEAFPQCRARYLGVRLQRIRPKLQEKSENFSPA